MYAEDPQYSFDPNNSMEEDYAFQNQNNNNTLDHLSSGAAMEIHSFNSLLLHDSSSSSSSLPLLPNFNSSSNLPDPHSDFLALYHLSTSSNFLPTTTNSNSISGDLPMPDPASMIINSDPILYLNPQPPFIPGLFHSPNALFHGEQHLQFHGDEDDHHGLADFNFNLGKRLRKPAGPAKVTKQHVNDRQKRVHVKDTFQTLKDLVPNPSKKDRASIVENAINYIKELRLSVNDLKMLAEKKRSRSRLYGGKKRVKTDEEEEEDDSMENGVESSCTITKPQNGSLRSSWLQRKSKDSEVDVRIVDDEVTIKVIQRQRINSLLHVSKVIDQLQLDLHHLAGGHVGDYYSFLFNAKINEGSCVYASAIANRIMEAVEGRS